MEPWSVVALVAVLGWPSAALPVTRRLLRDADAAVIDDGARARDLPRLLGLPDLPPRHRSHPPLHRHPHRERNLAWLKEALAYLRSFGYLRRGVLRTGEVWRALGEFQEVAGLRETGLLDPPTLRAMRRPRCGNPDISEHKPRGQAPQPPASEAKPRTVPGRLRAKRFAQVSSWDQVDNGKLRLTWFIQKYTKDIPPADVRRVVGKALELWADQVSIPSMRSVELEFSEATDAESADLGILWAEGEHGDAYPFDGAGNQTNILAHTFYPNYAAPAPGLNGDIHFDEHERWGLDGSDPDTVHFPYVLVHEIGHALGLGHSKRQEAVMNPIYKKFSLDSVLLDVDDKCAMHWNYVGPSNHCLFVWLMVELLPRAREQKGHAEQLGQVMDSGLGGDDNDAWARQSVRERLNATLAGFRSAEIPFCLPSNDVQSSYEVLLEAQLSFPPRSARRFGPVVCNFLQGLANFSHALARDPAAALPARRRREAGSQVSGDSPLDQASGDFLVELDQASGDSSLESAGDQADGAQRRRRSPSPQSPSPHASVHAWPSRRRLDEAAFEQLLLEEPPRRRKRKAAGSEEETASIYDKGYFSFEFFQKLVHILVHSPTRPARR